MYFYHPIYCEKNSNVYKKMITFPNAKINIGLNIVDRRSDGYHNLETVFYPVNIKDALEVVESDELSFNSSGVEIPGHADENLCLKAYKRLKNDFYLPPVNIHLHKHIPIGAGLGGGSADAAFFIKMLNDKFLLKLDELSMQNYARELGADCSFFIKNKPVFAYGKGDEFDEISLDLSSYFIVLVMPPVQVSTGEAYRGVRPTGLHVPLKELVCQSPEQWKYSVKNDFEESVFERHPLIGEVKTSLYDAGALYASMSGSGSSVYGIFKEVVSLEHLHSDNNIFYNI